MSFYFSNLLQDQTLLLILVFWELFWKGLGLWYASQNNQKIWFVAILLVNSLGILPIIYLLLFKLGYLNKIKFLIKRVKKV